MNQIPVGKIQRTGGRNTIRALLLLIHSNKDLQQADFILENGVREGNL